MILHPLSVAQKPTWFELYCLVQFTLLGVALPIVVFRLASSDQSKMKQGEVDAADQNKTRRAFQTSACEAVVGCFSLIMLLVALFISILMGSRETIGHWKRLLAKGATRKATKERRRFGVVTWEQIVSAVEQEWQQRWSALWRITPAAAMAIWFARH